MASKVALIAAVSPNWVIGTGKAIPWHYPGDFKRFKEVTMGHTVLMGRRTWDSLPKRPLPGRRNIVLTTNPGEAESQLISIGGRFDTPPSSKSVNSNRIFFSQLEEALASCDGLLWVIGGSEVYRLALPFAHEIDITHVPDEVTIGIHTVYFPKIDPEHWQAGPLLPHEYEPTLKRQLFTRR